MFTAATSPLAATAVLAAGALIGTSAPGPTDPPQGLGASQEHRHDGSAGHPDMAQMHERMMGGMGGGMMEGDSDMGMQ